METDKASVGITGCYELSGKTVYELSVAPEPSVGSTEDIMDFFTR